MVGAVVRSKQLRSRQFKFDSDRPGGAVVDRLEPGRRTPRPSRCGPIETVPVPQRLGEGVDLHDFIAVMVDHFDGDSTTLWRRERSTDS
jgi:hypothetical protein